MNMNSRLGTALFAPNGEFMQLSLEFRKALRRLGYRQNIDVRSCSKCGSADSQIAKDVKHPFYEKVIAARRELEKNRLSETLKRQVHDFVSRLHHTSRCCGYRYSFKAVDQQEAMWQLWLNRHALVLQTATGAAKERQRLVAMAKQQREAFMAYGIPVAEFSEEDMNAIRRAAGSGGKRRDDDFLILSRLACVGDIKTGQLLKIFRDEEQRQSQQNANESANVVNIDSARKPQSSQESPLLACLRA